MNTKTLVAFTVKNGKQESTEQYFFMATMSLRQCVNIDAETNKMKKLIKVLMSENTRINIVSNMHVIFFIELSGA